MHGDVVNVSTDGEVDVSTRLITRTTEVLLLVHDVVLGASDDTGILNTFD